MPPRALSLSLSLTNVRGRNGPSKLKAIRVQAEENQRTHTDDEKGSREIFKSCSLVRAQPGRWPDCLETGLDVLHGAGRS